MLNAVDNENQDNLGVSGGGSILVLYLIIFCIINILCIVLCIFMFCVLSFKAARARETLKGLGGLAPGVHIHVYLRIVIYSMLGLCGSSCGRPRLPRVEPLVWRWGWWVSSAEQGRGREGGEDSPPPSLRRILVRNFGRLRRTKLSSHITRSAPPVTRHPSGWQDRAPRGGRAAARDGRLAAAGQRDAECEARPARRGRAARRLRVRVAAAALVGARELRVQGVREGPLVRAVLEAVDGEHFDVWMRRGF